MLIIKIAVADSRKSKQWHNIELDWRGFAMRCKEAKRTNETLSEYLNMSKDRQSDIKDVGGFVGGHLIDGTAGRTKNNIALRSCLTLDIDNAPQGLWGQFTSVYTGAALCYSTHKHTPENPRLRIVVPFNREVTPEEYPAISRRFCRDYGLIEYADHTTHETNRLFYWCSMSADGEYFYQDQDGDPLDADRVLSLYSNWHDCSQWPTAPEEAGIIRTATGQVQDPTEKPGIIGAFCRTYTMPEAIDTFLSSIYEPCDTIGGNRYTYKKGSTSGGAILYDNKYLFSHHATDPAGGQLCNAFDLVRIHLFGNQDSDAKADTPHNRLPSYIAMSDLCTKDAATKHTFMREKTQTAVGDFAGVDNDSAASGDEWFTDLAVDRKGNILKTPTNLKLIILNDETLKHVRYNQFARENEITGGRLAETIKAGSSNDERLGKIALYMDEKYSISVPFKRVKEMLTATATERGFNPVKDFITATKWDGMRRVETLLIDYLGAADNAVNREVTRKWVTAAVARVFEPGCKFDNVLTLTGGQGIGKSSFLSTLVARREWFCDTLCLSDKDQRKMESVKGKWIVELSDLNGLSRAEWQELKGYISRDTDSGRAAYAIERDDIGRQYVFAATTNDTAFLREADKGNRRWWIVPVNGVDAVKDWIDRLRTDVPQIWAEAYQIYRNGEDFLNLSPQAAKYMSGMQWQYSEDADDPMPGMIDAYLDVLLPADWETRNENERRAYFNRRDMLEAAGVEKRDKICAVVYLYEREGLQPKDKGYKKAAIKFNTHLRDKGNWEEHDRIDFTIYGRQRGFIRKPDTPEDDDL